MCGLHLSRGESEAEWRTEERVEEVLQKRKEYPNICESLHRFSSNIKTSDIIRNSTVWLLPSGQAVQTDWSINNYAKMRSMLMSALNSNKFGQF